MGCQAAPAQLFCDFSLEEHVPAAHLLRRKSVRGFQAACRYGGFSWERVNALCVTLPRGMCR